MSIALSADAALKLLKIFEKRRGEKLFIKSFSPHKKIK
jgi:hypothetical protein